MARLLLHIGAEKTGTTHLQAFLEANAGRLGDLGLRYPHFLGQRNHTKVVAGFVPSVQDLHRRLGVTTARGIPALRADLDRMLGENVDGTSGTWIISSEHLSSRLVRGEQVDELRDLLRRHFDQITVLCYLRRQDFLVPSAYATSIRSGKTEPWTLDYILGQPEYLDLHAMVSRWRASFGSDHVLLRPFLEDDRDDPEALRSDFLAAAGLPPEAITSAAWATPTWADNARLSGRGVELLRLINPHVPQYNERGRVNPRRRALVAAVAAVTPGPPADLNPEQAAEVAQVYAADNAAMLGDLVARPEWSRWMTQAPGGSPGGTLTELGADEAVALMVELGRRYGANLWAGPATVLPRLISYGRVGAPQGIARRIRRSLRR